MKNYFVDLHVHIGRSSDGQEVKKATAKNLTFENIAYEAFNRKGIDVIGVVDCLSPIIIRDIDNLIDQGDLIEKKDGGMEYKSKQTLILGAEIETHEKPGSAHSLCFFPTLKQLKNFSNEMRKHIKNIEFRALMSMLKANELFNIVDAHGGIFIPAHVFTPHKSFYGSCCDSLYQIFTSSSIDKIPSIELGLSADSFMASSLSELDGKSFLSNSDAHSIPKMGREYNIFQMQSPNFNEILSALKSEGNRKIVANYGLNPALGKYHRTYCLNCDTVRNNNLPQIDCPVSKSHSVVLGVKDRLELIKDRSAPEMKSRPPYNYQIPLDFIPKVGPKTIDKLISNFGNEMNVLHNATIEELSNVVSEELSKKIILAREGRLNIQEGGGGVYGKIEE